MNTPKPLGRVVTFLLFFTACAVPAQNRLDTYLVEAGKNNPGLKSTFNEYQAALEQMSQVGGLPDPQVTFGYFLSPVETRVGPQQARVSATQMFPWFGTLGAKKDAATEKAKSKYEIFGDVKSHLFFDVKSAYYNLYFVQRAIAITGENIDILRMFRKLALLKMESGLVSSVDVLRVDMETADLETQLALLKDNFTAMNTGFNKLLNVDAQRAITLPDTLTVPAFAFAPEAMLDSIKNNNHQVLRMEYQEAMYAKQEIASKRMGRPNFMLGMDYIFVGKSSNPMTAASESGKDAIVLPMVGVSVPLYRHKYSSMVKEAVLMQQATGEALQDKINALETMFAKAEKEYNDATRRIPLNIDQAGRARTALHILETQYETNGADFAETLRMERQLLKYTLETERARTDQAVAIAFIHYLMGK